MRIFKYGKHIYTNEKNEIVLTPNGLGSLAAFIRFIDRNSQNEILGFKDIEKTAKAFTAKKMIKLFRSHFEIAVEESIKKIDD